MENKKSTRDTYFDFLRGIAIMGVVAIHTFIAPDNIDSFSLSAFVRQILNCSVPIFLFISGYFMANKVFYSISDYRGFLLKQGAKVYIPMLIWSLPYLVMSLYSGDSLFISTLRFLSGGFSIYYFIALIIQCYIVLPILTKLSNSRGVGLTLLITIFSMLGLFYLFYIKGISLPLLVYAGPLPVWVVFFVLGIHLNRMAKPLEISKINGGGAVIFLILSYIEMYYTSSYVGELKGIGIKTSSTFYSFSMIVFLYSLKSYYKTNVMTHFITKIGEISFAIYLTHMLILLALRRILPFGFELNWFVWFLLNISITCVFVITLRKVIPSKLYHLLGI